jgi:hypothetical protein
VQPSRQAHDNASSPVSVWTATLAVIPSAPSTNSKRG